MKVNDCFLLMGSKANEPMTVYCITQITKDKIWAKSICVKNESVDGWPTSDEYENDVPDDAILLPPDSWDWGKKQMLSFLKETYDYLSKNTMEGKPEIVVGGHYIEHGGIHTVKEIGKEKVKYKLFRLDEDNISPLWSGDVGVDGTNRWCAISDKTYSEVMRRYDEFLWKLRVKFSGCKLD